MLPLGNLRALQSNRDAGPEELMNRIRTGTWRIDDLIEILRQGLIGGGLKQAEAGPMVMALFEIHPAMEFKLSAYRVIAHALMGEKDDPLGEDRGAAPAPESGASAASTETESSAG